MTNQKKAKVGANITDALNTTGNVPRTVDHVGVLKRNVVFKVVEYLEEFTAWKSETLKQFYVVIHIQWICPKNAVSSDRMVRTTTPQTAATIVSGSSDMN